MDMKDMTPERKHQAQWDMLYNLLERYPYEEQIEEGSFAYELFMVLEYNIPDEDATAQNRKNIDKFWTEQWEDGSLQIYDMLGLV